MWAIATRGCRCRRSFPLTNSHCYKQWNPRTYRDSRQPSMKSKKHKFIWFNKVTNLHLVSALHWATLSPQLMGTKSIDQLESSKKQEQSRAGRDTDTDRWSPATSIHVRGFAIDTAEKRWDGANTHKKKRQAAKRANFFKWVSRCN